MKWLTDIGTVPVKRSQLELWRDGTLGEDWARRFDAGDRVVLLFRERGRGKESDVEVEHRGGWVYTLRDGKIVHGRVYRRPEALQAVGFSDRVAGDQ